MNDPPTAPAPGPAPECRCVIHHAITPDDKAEVKEQIDYHRSLPGTAGMRAVPLLLVRLNGHCPARPAQQPEAGQ